MKLIVFLGIIASIKVNASIIHCEPGLVFSTKTKTLSIIMDEHPFEDQLAPYFKSSTHTYYKTNLIWSQTLNSFYVKDKYSTVHVFSYFKERALRVVAHRKDFPTLSLKFEDCTAE